MTTTHLNDSVMAIKHAIDENPVSRESLKRLAPEIHVGRNQLLPVFKQITGKTIRRYRLEKRMEAAAGMLATGQFTIKEVAISCGHTCDQSSFSKLFKAIHKMAPEEWTRKNARINKVLLMETKIKKCN
jgi:iron complex transport system substrate-binding protein